MEKERLNYLLEQYRLGRLSAPEGDELLRIVNAEDDAWLVDNIADMMALEAEQPAVADEALVAQNIGRVLSIDKSTKRVRMYRPWAAAAAVLLLLAGGAIYLWKRPAPAAMVVATPAPDVLPGTNKAVLILADGSKVALDDDTSRTIRQGKTTVQQQGDQLIYEPAVDAPVAFNTLSTPRGAQFRATLPDGSHVILNAASSISYPIVFKGKERRVMITGEVYINVAANAAQPFMVQSGNVEIAVLGTEFNVNAYADEESVNTTLVNGKLKVNGQLLQPGQQARVQGNHVSVISDADVAAATAWKNGVFSFKDASLQAVMRQLGRWYDVTIVYEGNIPDRVFRGEIGRDLSLFQVLKGLDNMGVHFRIEEGRRLVVTP